MAGESAGMRAIAAPEEDKGYPEMVPEGRKLAAPVKGNAYELYVTPHKYGNLGGYGEKSGPGKGM